MHESDLKCNPSRYVVKRRSRETPHRSMALDESRVDNMAPDDPVENIKFIVI